MRVVAGKEFHIFTASWMSGKWIGCFSFELGKPNPIRKKFDSQMSTRQWIFMSDLYVFHFASHRIAVVSCHFPDDEAQRRRRIHFKCTEICWRRRKKAEYHLTNKIAWHFLFTWFITRLEVRRFLAFENGLQFSRQISSNFNSWQ